MFLDARCEENAQDSALSSHQVEGAANPKVFFCQYKEERLEQDEEWHRTGDNQSWQVWKWDHTHDELKLTTKTPQPMRPLTSSTEPFAIVAEMVKKKYLANKKIAGSQRLRSGISTNKVGIYASEHMSFAGPLGGK